MGQLNSTVSPVLDSTSFRALFNPPHSPQSSGHSLIIYRDNLTFLILILHSQANMGGAMKLSELK